MILRILHIIIIFLIRDMIKEYTCRQVDLDELTFSSNRKYD